MFEIQNITQYLQSEIQHNISNPKFDNRFEVLNITRDLKFQIKHRISDPEHFGIEIVR